MQQVYNFCRCGETGRRAGLKIQWANTPCRFESDQRHQRKTTTQKGSLFCLSQYERTRISR